MTPRYSAAAEEVYKRQPSDRASLAKLWRLQGDLGNDILKGSFGNDLGLEGGDKGSEIVMTGTPAEVAEHPTW